MLIEREVLARKDVFWVMNMWGSKACYFFPLGIFISVYLKVEIQAVHERP